MTSRLRRKSINCLSAMHSLWKTTTPRPRDRRYLTISSDETRIELTLSVSSQRLKHAASRIRLRREYKAYPSSCNHLANSTMWVAKGPSKGHERTTSSLTMHFIAELPSVDPVGLTESDYAVSVRGMKWKMEHIRNYPVIVPNTE